MVKFITAILPVDEYSMAVSLVFTLHGASHFQRVLLSLRTL
jgi:hypothetical protein